MITPQEAKRITPDETKAIQEAEKAVDADIRAKAARGIEGVSPLQITASFQGLSPRAQEALAKRYRENGWEVTRRLGSQRNPGVTWEFKPSKQPDPFNSLAQQIEGVESMRGQRA